MEVAVGVGLLLLGIVLYLLPTIVALCREHRNSLAILVLNLGGYARR